MFPLKDYRGSRTEQFESVIVVDFDTYARRAG
jgi:hypothetical protein